MNFFQRQTETRRLSRWLIVLFLLSVVVVVVAVDVVVFTTLTAVQPDIDGPPLSVWEWMNAHPGVVIITTASVIGVIGLSSLYKTAMLSGGGGVVARSLGGVRISADTADLSQRRLLNVVEEMAIASGVPMPEVYLLEHESGINAFAAGYNPANAAIAVTHGALTTLNRNELQGVIAHEFSHLLNGDMRVNIRIMGLLFGLLAIAVLARTVLRFVPQGRSGNRRGGAAGGIFVIMVAAVAVLVIGYIGLFFGRLIQAAVSRSRESLADASAVQFTRDPAGLRGALVKIGATARGSYLATPQGEEVAHMLFAPGMSRLFATHPGLERRLKAIDPRFDASEFDDMRERLAAERQAVQSEQARARQSTGPRAGGFWPDNGGAATADTSPTVAARLNSLLALPATVATVTELVGNPGTLHVAAAQQIRQSLPESLSLAGRHPASARALFLALALEPDPDARERQQAFIARQLGNQVVTAMQGLQLDVDTLQPQQRMPVLMRAFPALRQLPRDERVKLMACLNGMLQREGRMSLPTYALRKLAQVQLRDDLDPRGRVGKLSLSTMSRELQVLFAVLAQHGHSEQSEARQAYEVGIGLVLPHQRAVYVAPEHWAPQLDVALTRLDRLTPQAKEQLVQALVRTIVSDRRLTVGEAELLRAVCASLHCPLPPLTLS